jgi:hypothetical protein
MRFIVYGKGWIGTQLATLIEHAGDEVVFGRRVTSFEAIRAEIEEVKPDRIICSLGRTSGKGINNIDYLEDKLQENVDSNLNAPLILAQVS